jgi:hypothetical protein
VKERTEEAIMRWEKKYAVVDLSGMVLRIVAKNPPSLPLIESMKITKAVPGEAMQVEDVSILSDTIMLLQAVGESDLYFSKIVVSDVNVKAYIYQELICEGTFDNIAKNLDNIAQVILDLQSKNIEKGTITVSGNGTCSFKE